MIKNRGRQLGNYRISRLLGHGGFAEVYYGEHIYLATPAAIKVLNVAIAGNEQEKFLSEARLAAHLEHPHIISVLEFGVEHTVPYLVMDYASHGTLRQRHPKGTRLTPVQIAPYVQQLAAALQYTHSQQLIHRDIKPENMLLGEHDIVMLSDFGIALVMQQAQTNGSEQRVVGTVAYMAPEQLQGQPGPASDQYALGAVIYEWLCGEPPFNGSYTEVAIQHALLPPTPLSQHVPQLSSAVEEVVMVALAKEPEARFRSIQAFANAFIQACSVEQERPASSYYPVVDAPPDYVPPEHSAEPPQEPVAEKKHLSRRMLIGALLAGGGLTAGGLIAWKTLVPRFFTSPPSQGQAGVHTPTPGTTIYTYHGHSFVGFATITMLAWSRDSQRIASAEDNVQIWDATTGRLERAYSIASYSSISQGAGAWSPNNRSIALQIQIPNQTADPIGEIWLWDTASGKKITSYPQKNVSGAIGLIWSPDNTMLAGSLNGPNLQVWQALTGKIVASFQANTSDTATSYSLSWSPDGKFIASAASPAGGVIPSNLETERTVHIWNATTGETHAIYQGHTGPVLALAWSPDGTYLASGSGLNYDPGNNPTPTQTSAIDNEIHIWKPGDTKPLVVYRGHFSPPSTISWAPGGRAIVSGSSGSAFLNKTTPDALVQVWDATTGKTILNYRGHNHTNTESISIVAWSPDGKLIASAGTDGTVQVWQAPAASSH